MSSPIPPDPYEALGVAKDADLNTVRVAHRKLALKHHPDRIRDAAERENGKNEFQKIQHAYEILSDPTRRARYDDRVRLAELRRERMTREASRPAAPSTPTVRREYSEEGYFYEDRAPPSSFFDEPVLGTTRKSESYETRRKPSTPKTEKREWTKWDGPVENISHKMAFHLKSKAGSARGKVAEKQRDKVAARDREKRRDRADKESDRRRVYVMEDTDSEVETVVPPTPRPSIGREPSSRSKKSADTPEVRRRVHPSARFPYDDDTSLDEEEKWERHHKTTRDYIRESQKRPGLTRSGSSDAHMYWASESVVGGCRRSGSDSEKRPSSSRRPTADASRPPPSMPVHTSAPGNLRSRAGDREPVRSQTSTYPSERERAACRDAPGLARSATMPVSSRASKKESSAPSRSSNLKHAETQDSGYSSQSTPEMRGESPPRESSRREKSTRYTIVDAESEGESNSRGKRVGARVAGSDEDSHRRRVRSPETLVREPDRRDRERERERDRPRYDSDSRSKSSRGPTLSDLKTSVPRDQFTRDSHSPRGTGPVPRKQLFGEVPDRSPDRYAYRPDPSQLRTNSYRAPSTASYSTYRPRDDDDYPGSAFFEQRYPTSRRSSAARAY